MGSLAHTADAPQVWEHLKLVIWIVDHWVELILLLVALFIINRLYSISHNIEAIRVASVENVSATNSVRDTVAQVAFASTSVEKALSEMSRYGYQTLHELEAIGGKVNDASEVLIYGREAHDRRLEAERKERIADYARHIGEVREKAEAGDLQAQGFYASHWAIREDYVQAHIWYNIATACAPDWRHGLEQRDQIARKMTPEQLAEAESKARDWLDTHPASPAKLSGPDL